MDWMLAAVWGQFSRRLESTLGFNMIDAIVTRGRAQRASTQSQASANVNISIVFNATASLSNK